jgi:hypothetical protein
VARRAAVPCRLAGQHGRGDPGSVPALLPEPRHRGSSGRNALRRVHAESWQDRGGGGVTSDRNVAGDGGDGAPEFGSVVSNFGVLPGRPVPQSHRLQQEDADDLIEGAAEGPTEGFAEGSAQTVGTVVDCCRAGANLLGSCHSPQLLVER